VTDIDELCHALFMAKRALEESADLVSTEYATDRRHGIPTRLKQLAGMKALVDAHYSAIASAQAALAGKPERKAQDDGGYDLVAAWDRSGFVYPDGTVDPVFQAGWDAARSTT